MPGDFRKLNVWQKSHSLALMIDLLSSNIRSARHASLRSQLTRAAMSIPANIAEGRRQATDREFVRFLRYSVNSAYELEYHLVVAQDTGAIPDDAAKSALADLVETRRMLHGLIRKIGETKESPPLDPSSLAH
jgi:four helix bundle protein